MRNIPPTRRTEPSEGEDGYMLLAVICMLALLTISLAVAVPDITKSIQRDQEIETMHRGMQYRRAIQLYYRKFHAYPPSIDALVKTDNIRFLRKRYLDPMTRKDDWKPIYFGQNKAPLAMGFFGQPLGGLTGATPIAGTGPSGGNGVAGSGVGGQSSTGSTFGSSFGSGSSIGGNSPGGSLFGSSNNGSTGSATDSSGTSTDGSSSGTGSTGTGSTSGNGFMSGQSGQTFGGAGIVGFEPGDPKQSILLYKKKDHYNQWEFTYSPLSDMQQQAGNGGVTGGSSTGSGTGSGATPGFGSTPGFGGPAGAGIPSGAPGTGSSNTFGGSGASSTPQ